MNDQKAGDEVAVNGRLPLGALTLDLGCGDLFGADGRPAPLRRQALEVLLVLGRRANQVVTKDELMSAVWPAVVVGDGSLAAAVADIRRVLGDGEHLLVRNIARRGYMLVPSPSHSGPVPSSVAQPRPAWGRWVAASALLLAMVVALVVWTRGKPAIQSDKALSIVVLPLKAEGAWPDTEAFADVLHNDLIAEASRFEASTVIARGTAATYKGRGVDPREVARELQVRHVVSGSLRRDGDKLRLSLTLVDGESGVQRWSEVFEFERALLGQTVDEAVRELARALYIQAWKSAAVRAAALSPSQVTGDDLATRAMGLWFRGLNRDNVLGLLALAEQAVATDPDSARGWGMIAIGNVQALNNNWIEGAEARSAARLRAEQASAALDRIAPDGFFAMQARVIEAYNRSEFPTMLQRARLWVERHPHPVALGALGAALFHNDQPEAAVVALERALRLSPLDSFRAEWMYRLAWSHYIVGNLDRALEWSRRARATNPLLPWPPVEAASLLQLGQRAEAQSVLNEFRRRHPSFDHAAIGRRLSGDSPRFAAARSRLLDDLTELGMK
ncbi:MAG: winged helix-turn-helix domain-containing protein [Burkholderiaceae bacterium]|nr:winged helix-turn-helix domain-containing protein [Burkholderiaceae bacterium]